MFIEGIALYTSLITGVIVWTQFSKELFLQHPKAPKVSVAGRRLVVAPVISHPPELEIPRQGDAMAPPAKEGTN